MEDGQTGANGNLARLAAEMAPGRACATATTLHQAMGVRNVTETCWRWCHVTPFLAQVCDMMMTMLLLTTMMMAMMVMVMIMRCPLAMRVNIEMMETIWSAWRGTKAENTVDAMPRGF